MLSQKGGNPSPSASGTKALSLYLAIFVTSVDSPTLTYLNSFGLLPFPFQPLFAVALKCSEIVRVRESHLNM